MPLYKVDCSESVEEALARLDLESKQNKLAKEVKLAAEKEKVKEVKLQQSSQKVSSSLETVSEDPMSLENESNPVDYPKDDKSRVLFPERGGEAYKSSWFDIAFKGEGREGIDKIKCETKVWEVINQSHLVRLMMDALRASGCEIDIRRHISCEVCDRSVTGGFDPFLNQVVICQNTARNKGLIQGSLTHELIHMFDYCRHKLDLTDERHLACTEIRAANLAHCSYVSGLFEGSLSLGNVKEQHRECVRQRAIRSVLAVRNVSQEDAIKTVDSVFEKCYNDLEPVGRRIRRKSNHMQQAYWERISMGYI